MTKLILIFSFVLLSTLVTADEGNSDESDNSVDKIKLTVDERLTEAEIDTRNANQNIQHHDNLILAFENILADLESKLSTLETTHTTGYRKHEDEIVDLKANITGHEGRIKILEFRLQSQQQENAELSQRLCQTLLGLSERNGLSLPFNCKGTGRGVGAGENKLGDQIGELERQLLAEQNKPTQPPIVIDDTPPVDFIYIQLPRQKEPSAIWKNGKWDDISHDYEGLFFRAEGNDSLPFGEIQDDQTRQITKAEYMFFEKDDVPCTADFAPKGWTEHIKTGLYDKNKYNSNTAVRFFTDDVEVRPRNTAIRVWKRSS